MNILAKKAYTFDDVVFENRNQLYGAYVLRRSYNATLFKAFSASGLLLLLLLIITVRLVNTDNIHILNTGTVVATDPPMDPPKPNEPIEEPKKADPAKSNPKPQDQVATHELPILDPLGTKPLPLVDPNPKTPIGTTTQPGVIGPLLPGTGGTGTGTDTTTNTGGSGSEPTKPFVWVQDMPKFPGGEAAMMKFIAKEATRDNQWSEMGLTGVIYVQFVVNADGSVSNVEAVKGQYETLKKVAVRAIKSMPNWTPGRQNDRAVPVLMVIPISFKQS